MVIPIKAIISIGVTAVCGAGSAIVSQIMQKREIEEIGEKISKQIMESLKNQEK